MIYDGLSTEEDILIIVEGPDGAGKSTLVNDLANRSRLPVIGKAVSSDQVALLNMSDYVEENLNRGFQKALFDRFGLISGPIYGNVSGMKPPNEAFLDRIWHFRMEALLLGIRPVIIYCLPPLPIIRANLLRDRVSSRVVGRHLDQLYYMYQARAARDFALGIAGVYDYTLPDSKRLAMQRISLRLGDIGETPWL